MVGVWGGGVVITYAKNSVTIPMFRVGCEPLDLVEILRAMNVIK